MSPWRRRRTRARPGRPVVLVEDAAGFGVDSPPSSPGLVVMLAIVLVVGALRDDPAPLSREEVARAIDDALASQTPAQPRAELVYAAIGPSIVAIETEGTDREGLATSGSGTGVVVSDQGDVLTALHVVDGRDHDRPSASPTAPSGRGA